MAKEGLQNLGIQGVDHVDFVVHDLERSRTFYEGKMDFALAARSGTQYEEATGERSLVFDAAKVRVQVTAPTRKDSAAGRFLKNHPDGVRTVTFRVSDLDHAWKTLESRGANFIEEPAGKPGHRSFAIASPLGDVQYVFLEKGKAGEAAGPGGVDPRLTPVVRTGKETAGGNRHRFTHFDHITSNTLDMRNLSAWYRDVLGFEHFWDIRFHTRDAKPDPDVGAAGGSRTAGLQAGTGGSGLNSIVMWDPSSNVKFATNEPLRPNFYNSQIAKFCDDNKGPGVQHIAFATGHIMDVIPQMRTAGLKFLETPDAYYAMLPKRLAERGVENLKEEIEELRKRRILVDGRDNRYLLQIFMQEGALLYNEAAAGPFFYEVIQRYGDQGFGEGNFRALFESIERQQTGETQRTVNNPYLMD